MIQWCLPFSTASAHNEASRILALRLIQDQLFDQKETHREDTIVTKWTIADINGEKQLVTRYGEGYVSLRELWRHTEEFALRVGKPEAFNRSEMQTQIAIQDALINGRATEAMFTLSHPESVRYVQQWQQGTDGTFYSTQIDIGKFAGRDLRHDEVKSFLDRFRDKYRDTAIHVDGAVAGSYVAVRGKIDTMTIVTTAKHVNMRADGDIFHRNSFFVLGQLPRENEYASDRIYPLWVIRDRRWFSDNKKDGDTEIREAHEARDVSRQPEASNKPEIHPIKAKRYVFKTTVSGAEFLRKEYESRHRMLYPLRIIAETKTIAHAIPMIIASLAEKLPAPVRAMEKSIKRHKKKEIRLKNHEVRKRKLDAGSDVKEGQSFKIEHKGRKKRRKTHKEVLTSDNKHIPKERKALRKRKRKIGVGEKTGKKSAVVDRLTVFTFKKEKRLRRRRLRQEAKREKKLWRLVTGLARRMEHQRKEINRTPHKITKSESVRRTKTREVARKETVDNFSFAFILWLLFRHFEKQVQTHVTEKLQEAQKEENLLVSQEIGQKQNQEGLTVKEPTPCILLSIIWYLAMAREAGTQQAAGSRQQAATKKKKKIKQTYKKHMFFPKHAVIFAFNS